MTQPFDNRPIGVFDSGVGGLTVVHALHQYLPQERIIYLGDTARVPYGVKSRETIIRYSLENSDFLLTQGVKAIVVACNSSSAHALEAIRDHCRLPVFGVIEPGIRAALSATKNNHVAVIGTAATISSNVYSAGLKAAHPEIQTVSVACPLFVPLVEEGWLQDAISEQIVERYLSVLKKEEIDTLILGCTHYPLLGPLIEKVMGNHITLIDSGQACASDLATIFKQKGLLNERKVSGDSIYVTDLPDKFEIIARRFLGEAVPPVTSVSYGG